MAGEMAEVRDAVDVELFVRMIGGRWPCGPYNSFTCEVHAPQYSRRAEQPKGFSLLAYNASV